MNRRNLLGMFGSGVALAALAGCGGTLGKIGVDVKLPDSLQAVVDDATAIVNKVKGIGSVAGLVDDAKALIDKLKAGATADAAKSIVTSLVSVLGSMATKLPGAWGVVASAVETLLPEIGSAVGLRMMARRPTGMSPAYARAVLRS